MNFVILDTDDGVVNSIPIILGCSFSLMFDATIRFRTGVMTMCVGKISIEVYIRTHNNLKK